MSTPDNYFHTFHLNYPLLDQAEIRRNFSHLVSSAQDFEIDSRNEKLCSSLSFLILYLVIAISLLLDGRLEHKNVASLIYSQTVRLLSAQSSATVNVQLLRHTRDETYVVQFIFLLAIYRLLYPYGDSAWQLARYAMDTSVMFGFHRLESNTTQAFSLPNETAPPRDLIARKEVILWSCFCLERSVAIYWLTISFLCAHELTRRLSRELSALLDRSCCVQPIDIDPLPSPCARTPSYIHVFMRHMVEYYQIQAGLSRRRSDDSFSYISVLRGWRAAAPASLDLDKIDGATPARSLAQVNDAELSQRWDTWYYRGILECIDVSTQQDHPIANLAIQACLYFLDPTTEQNAKSLGFRWDTALFYFSVGTTLANLSAKQVAAGTRQDLSEIVIGLSRCSDILSKYLAEFPILAPYSRLWYQFSSEITMLLNTRLVRQTTRDGWIHHLYHAH